MGRELLACRPGCAACCIAPSITSAIPGMPDGKPAGEPCVQLDEHGFCLLFNDPQRPDVCALLQPATDMCGSSDEQALKFLTDLETNTA